jgi:hypothetical protein
MAIEAAIALMPVGGTGKLAHSIRVPQFYKFSSKVLLKYLQFKGRIPKLIQQQTRGEKEYVSMTAHRTSSWGQPYDFSFKFS